MSTHGDRIILHSPKSLPLAAGLSRFFLHFLPVFFVTSVLLFLTLIPATMLSPLSLFRLEVHRALTTHHVLYPALIQIAGLMLIPLIARRIRRCRRSLLTRRAIYSDIQSGMKKTQDQQNCRSCLARSRVRQLLCGLLRAWRSGRGNLMDQKMWRRFRTRNKSAAVLVLADPEDTITPKFVRDALATASEQSLEEEELGIPLPALRPYIVLVAYAAIIGAIMYLGYATFTDAFVNATVRPPLFGMSGIGTFSFMLAMGWHALRTYNGFPFDVETTIMNPEGIDHHGVLGSKRFSRHKDIMAIRARDDLRSFAVKFEDPESGRSVRLAVGPVQAKKLVAMWLAPPLTAAHSSTPPNSSAIPS